MKFSKWIETLVEEKGLDLESTFEFQDQNGANVMPYGVVVEAAKIASPAEQAQIKNMLVLIDFKNGDIRHFLRHLGMGLAAQRGAAF